MVRFAMAMLLVSVGCHCAGPAPESSSTPNEHSREPTVVAVADAQAVAAVAPEVAHSAAFTVASYNLNFGLAGDPDTLEHLRGLQADVVLLQETHRGWEPSLRAALQGQYPYVAFHHDRYRPGGLAIFSRLRFQAHDVVVPTAGRFPAWPVTVQTGFGPVQVVNVHLYPPVLKAQQGWVRAYLSALQLHQREIVEIHRALADDLPTVVAGDFNENLAGTAIAWLTERGFRPAVREPSVTWRWTTPAGTVSAQLDHVLLNRQLRLVDAKVEPGGSSDHYPVVVTLEASAPGVRQ